MNILRLGVVGIGNMGSEHCRSLIAGKVPEIRLTAIADRRDSRRKWAEENLPGVKIFGEGSDLIGQEGCDAVLIATPHYQHPGLSVEAMRHGLHVLSEKPIGVFPQDVREAIRVSRETGRVYALMFNQRTNSVYRKLHDLVRSGEMGQVKRVSWTITDWYRTQCYYDSGSWRATWDGEGGGVLMNQCPHQLDLLQWIVGMPSSLQAFMHIGKWHHIEVEDDVTAYMEYPNGATGIFVASTGDLPGVNRLEITMDRGRICCDGSKIELWRSPVNERAYCFTSDSPFPDITPFYEIVPTDGQNPQHCGVLNAFAGHILHGDPLIAEGAEGLNGLLLADAMYLSAWTGEKVCFPFDEDKYLRLLVEHRKQSAQKRDVDVTFRTDHSYGGQLSSN